MKQTTFFLLIFMFLGTMFSYSQDTVYIDPTNSSDPARDGSQEHPFAGLSEFSLTDNTTYLLKRGTVLEESSKTELTNLTNVTIGAYGNGARPQIQTSSVLVKSCNGLTLEHLDIYADGSHCIEFNHHAKSKNIVIDSCLIHSVPNWDVGDYNYGISAGADSLKIINSEVYDIYRDGLYFDHAFHIEIRGCYIHDVNQHFLDDPDNSGGDGIQFVSSDHILLKETVIDRTGTSKKFCVIVQNGDDELTISDVVFDDNHFIGPEPSSYGGAGLFIGVHGITIRRNIIEGAPSGVFTHAHEITINNNLFINNSGGVSVASNHAEIYNNVFYGNGLAVHSSHRPSTIKNNIVYLTDSEDEAFNDAECIVSHNIQNISSTTSPWFDAGTIADPKFANADSHDFHLLSNSPAIDKGDEVGVIYDFDHNVIPCNGTPDIGAFEYQGGCGDTTNHRPVAVAGQDQQVQEEQLVILDGSDSYDPDYDALTFLWESLSGIALSDNSAEQPEFAAPKVDAKTTFQFILIVSDGELESYPDTVEVTVTDAQSSENSAPVAEAGEDKTVNENVWVELSGESSYDPDDDSLYFHWQAPEGIVLSDSTAIQPGFSAPEISSDTVLRFALTVNDGNLSSEPDTVNITVQDVATSLPIELNERRVDGVLFPNPSNGELYIQLAGNRSFDGVEVRIYSIQGQLVKMIKLHQRLSGDAPIMLSVDELPQGAYICSVFYEGSRLFNQRFLKQP